jgi:hypothetical protein
MVDATEVQHVLQAITALFHHEDRSVKDQANRWLEEWQQRPEAWQISDLYLHSANGNTEAQYFFAQTLKLKVRHSRPNGTTATKNVNSWYTILRSRAVRAALERRPLVEGLPAAAHHMCREAAGMCGEKLLACVDR